MMASQPSGTPKKAPTKLTLSKMPVSGNEIWNLCEKLMRSGPYSEEVAPISRKIAVALAKANGRKVTSVAMASEEMGELESMDRS